MIDGEGGREMDAQGRGWLLDLRERGSVGGRAGWTIERMLFERRQKLCQFDGRLINAFEEILLKDSGHSCTHIAAAS